MRYTYRTQGTCSQAIEFEIEDGVLKNVQFYGGCNGNTQGVSALVEGMKVEDVLQRLEGIRCGFKGTSCPDQLCRAIREALSISAQSPVKMGKKELRAKIKSLKKEHTKEQLLEQSEKILAKLEQHPDFIKADKVMLYSALPDEVQTQAFLEKWHLKKHIILPTVVGDDIIPVEYGKDTDFAVGDFNILEPQNEPYTGNFDLIIVPGVAFDRKGNRLGRGRGYYDRFLSQHFDVKRIGICFDFQLVDEVPAEDFDIRMDEVFSL